MLLALFMALACAAESPPAHTFAVIEEAGVPVAVNSATPKHEGELFEYEKVLEIRADPGEPDSYLYGPRSFTLGDDGRYYVADTGNHRVAVFDADGRFVRDIGRRGEGPGELQTPASLEVHDGVVSVFTRERTTRFRTDGTLVEVITTTVGRVGKVARRAGNGALIVMDGPQGPRGDGYYYLGGRIQVVDEDAAGGEGEVTATIALPEVPVMKVLSTGADRADLNYGGAPDVRYLPGDERLVMTSGVEPVVSWYDLEGRLRRQVRIDLPAEPVSAEDRALVEDRHDRLAEAARAAGAPAATLELLQREKERLHYAERKGYWRGILAEDRGWLWLRIPMPQDGTYYAPRGRPFEPISQRQHFRIVDPAGEFVGATRWPPEVRAFGARVVDGRLLAMVPDAGGGETIPTVYRIRPAVPGLRYP